jgi:hypothetical protein
MRSRFVVPSEWLATNQRVPSGAVVSSCVIRQLPFVWCVGGGAATWAGDGYDGYDALPHIGRVARACACVRAYTVDKGQSVISVIHRDFSPMKPRPCGRR